MSLIKTLLAIVSSLLLCAALLLTGLCYEIDRTLLNPAFVTAEFEQADGVGLGKAALLERLPEEARAFAPAITATIDQQHPWILQEMRRVVNEAYAFLLGKTDRWQLAIDSGPFRRALMQNVQAQLQKNPPADYQKLSAAQKKQFQAEIESTVNKLVIPGNFDLGALDAGQQKNIDELRERIRIFQIVYKLLLGADVIIALVILWAGSSLLLAIIALLAGTALHVLLLLSSGLEALLPPDYATHLPTSLQNYLPKFYENLGAPLRSYAWGCLLGSLLFLVLWLVMRSIRRSFATKPAIPA